MASTQVPAAGAEQMRDAHDEARGILGVQRVGVDDGGASAAARDREARGGEDRAQRAGVFVLRLAAEVAREGGGGYLLSGMGPKASIELCIKASVCVLWKSVPGGIGQGMIFEAV